MIVLKGLAEAITLKNCFPEYDKYQAKQANTLSPVEKHFIESIDALELIADKQIDKKKK